VLAQPPQVTFGFVNEAGMESLLRVMKGVYVPQLTTNTTWPDSVRKEVTGQVNRFMASLIETVRPRWPCNPLYPFFPCLFDSIDPPSLRPGEPGEG
jgi:hypothetical protein